MAAPAVRKANRATTAISNPILFMSFLLRGVFAIDAFLRFTISEHPLCDYPSVRANGHSIRDREKNGRTIERAWNL
jgi:hypothetical protein